MSILSADDSTPQATTPPPALSGSSAVDAARRAVRSVYELTGLEAEGVTALEPSDDGWRVEVEVVELERTPDTTDVLATYELTLDAHGQLVSYRRTQRYQRGQVDAAS